MKNTILDTTLTPQNYFDSHCHLQFPEFDENRDEVINRARAAGLSKLLIPGTDFESSVKAVELANKYPDYIEAAIGNHPYEADKSTDAQMAQYEDLIKTNPTITAIGETGLDTFRNALDIQIQINSLTKHAKLAKFYNYYLIIHSRETDEVTSAILKILQEQKIEKVIFHCFSGSQETAKTIWSRGYKTSFSCNITYPKNEALLQTFKTCPASLRLLETDSPYLAPQSQRGKRNEPANVKDLLQYL
ncbi:hydrolase TatD [Candidatus Peregrinibacteria bacterium CG11_big_fil_rev_8_21_14_0_20_41_10]|nr:MAG: hydrolase TatD [Candidatus Peregrinibacteria bacterium CG11_big_fil_rev_8_21_14_0_20_41_10]PIZ76349.1 MAG: hydrolase TatD [Candidatus Peregrinibacteria bacterium CG_4_10_14_0_2_um_filter_41_8]PJC37628.1 MAG: hydrolase TatD [Candidatus Peregrinibacteria bacterium CG_4_9_14_0_2_um_filter_41_14]